MVHWKDPKFKFLEMITGPSAQQLIHQAGLFGVTQGPLVVLDNACGSGIVTSLLYQNLDASAKERLGLTCGDVAQEMVAVIQQRITDNNWEGATTRIVDAQNTGLPDSYFTHVVTSMGVMHMPDSESAVKEIARILRHGGVCAFSTWQKAGWGPDVQAVLATIPGAPPFPDAEVIMMALSGGARWHDPLFVEQRLAAHGFEDIDVGVVASLASVDDAAAYAELFTPMLARLASVVWSGEDCERYCGLMKPALLKYMTEKYGEGRRIEWEMVAIIATARKPF